LKGPTRACRECGGLGWVPYTAPTPTGVALAELYLTEYKAPCKRCSGIGLVIRKKWIAACQQLRLHEAIDDAKEAHRKRRFAVAYGEDWDRR
jgi:hypothetical protein